MNQKKNILKALGVGALCLAGTVAFAGCTSMTDEESKAMMDTLTQSQEFMKSTTEELQKQNASYEDLIKEQKAQNELYTSQIAALEEQNSIYAEAVEELKKSNNQISAEDAMARCELAMTKLKTQEAEIYNNFNFTLKAYKNGNLRATNEFYSYKNDAGETYNITVLPDFDDSSLINYDILYQKENNKIIEYRTVNLNNLSYILESQNDFASMNYFMINSVFSSGMLYGFGDINNLRSVEVDMYGNITLTSIVNKVDDIDRTTSIIALTIDKETRLTSLKISELYEDNDKVNEETVLKEVYNQDYIMDLHYDELTDDDFEGYDFIKESYDEVIALNEIPNNLYVSNINLEELNISKYDLFISSPVESENLTEDKIGTIYQYNNASFKTLLSIKTIQGIKYFVLGEYGEDYSGLDYSNLTTENISEFAKTNRVTILEESEVSNIYSISKLA